MMYMGFEIGVQGWGNALLTFDQTQDDLDWMKADPKCGGFVWAYFSTAAAGLPVAQDVLKMIKNS